MEEWEKGEEDMPYTYHYRRLVVAGITHQALDQRGSRMHVLSAYALEEGREQHQHSNSWWT
jgi:hypothetical protein